MIFDALQDFSSIQKYGHFIAAIANVVATGITYVLNHSVQGLIFSFVYFLVALFLPDFICG